MVRFSLFLGRVRRVYPTVNGKNRKLGRSGYGFPPVSVLENKPGLSETLSGNKNKYRDTGLQAQLLKT